MWRILSISLGTTGTTSITSIGAIPALRITSGEDATDDGDVSTPKSIYVISHKIY
jgi:hypothetical protein